MKIQSHSFVDVPKGTKLIMPNPKWDGDKPKSQYFVEVKTAEILSVEVLGEYKCTVLRTKIPEHEVQR